jgi:transcription antitermination factor NusG
MVRRHMGPFGVVSSVSLMNNDWYAIYTKSRHEKVVAEELWQREIEVFLPLRNVVSRWKDRRKEVQFPLFPGYLFVRTDIQRRRLDILKVPSVVRIIGFNNEPAPVDALQIEAVKTLVFSKLPYDPFPEMVVGDRVRVRRGPLRGLDGYLIEKKSRFRFVITVDLIQQAVSCEIDAADVEKLG